MGYSTDFEITVARREKHEHWQKHPESEEIELIRMWKKFKQISKDYVHFTGDPDRELTVSDASWYDHEGDFLDISQQFPHFVFKVEGKGEEHGDWWAEVYSSGKRVDKSTAKMVAPDVTETLHGAIYA